MREWDMASLLAPPLSAIQLANRRRGRYPRELEWGLQESLMSTLGQLQR